MSSSFFQSSKFILIVNQVNLKEESKYCKKLFLEVKGFERSEIDMFKYTDVKRFLYAQYVSEEFLCQKKMFRNFKVFMVGYNK